MATVNFGIGFLGGFTGDLVDQTIVKENLSNIDIGNSLKEGAETGIIALPSIINYGSMEFDTNKRYDW